jgi:hypothetical protein
MGFCQDTRSPSEIVLGTSWHHRHHSTKAGTVGAKGKPRVHVRQHFIHVPVRILHLVLTNVAMSIPRIRRICKLRPMHVARDPRTFQIGLGVVSWILGAAISATQCHQGCCRVNILARLTMRLRLQICPCPLPPILLGVAIRRICGWDAIGILRVSI